ncbi:D-alanine--D-alanine ligase [bacterium]|nr:D-alanine--D-alanine ligase [candidate division CSSED10-310 bacterium]
MRAVILFNRISPDPTRDESDVLQQMAAVSEALSDLGWNCESIPFDLELAGIRKTLLEMAPDLVFNLVESVERSGMLIHYAPALLNMLDIPYTGAHLESMFTTSNKILAKKLLTSAHLPTPPWITTSGIASGNPVPHGKWIVKSVWEHASIGLDDNAIVDAETNEQLKKSLSERIKQGGQWFAERYIDGREFNLSVLAGEDGPEVLAPAEIRFLEFGPDKPKMVGYRAKWDEQSFEYRNTVRTFTFPDTDRDLLQTLKHLAGECWHLFGLNGYARVDFRIDSRGGPWILEVNANPCLSKDAGFAAAVQNSGLSYTRAIQRIIRDALPGNRPDN